MMLAAYRAAGPLAAPALRRLLKQRVARGKEVAGRLGERFGEAGLPRPEGRLIWLHAASVGETMSILPLIDALTKTAEVLLTTGTATSARLAAERLPARARHQFVPLDVPAWTGAFIRHWRPDAAVFVESELWPGLLDDVDAAGIPRLLINARLSAKSLKQWQRAPNLARHVIKPFRHIHAQSAGDAANFRALGLTDILEWGNLKFAAAPLPADAADVAAFAAAAPPPSWLAASTHPGEEAIILAAHTRLLERFPGLITVIVPRHPERGAEVAALCAAPRRSEGAPPARGKVYVADTLGELGLFFRAAPFAFIGSSLVGSGGHNLIEPACLGRPVITGPHTENFVDAAASLREAGALMEVADAAELAEAAGRWLGDPQGCATAGRAAAAAVARLGDLPARLATLILDCAL
jgi:3-deoxy-D-manno-octulosonic-acid transferase